MWVIQYIVQEELQQQFFSRYLINSFNDLWCFCYPLFVHQEASSMCRLSSLRACLCAPSSALASFTQSWVRRKLEWSLRLTLGEFLSSRGAQQCTGGAVLRFADVLPSDRVHSHVRESENTWTDAVVTSNDRSCGAIAIGMHAARSSSRSHWFPTGRFTNAHAEAHTLKCFILCAIWILNVASWFLYDGCLHTWEYSFFYLVPLI